MTAASKRVDEARSSDPPIAEPLTSSTPLGSAGPGRDDALKMCSASHAGSERMNVPLGRRGVPAIVGAFLAEHSPETAADILEAAASLARRIAGAR